MDQTAVTKIILLSTKRFMHDIIEIASINVCKLTYIILMFAVILLRRHYTFVWK